MHTGKGQVVELILEGGSLYMRVACHPSLIPAPGQYLLASDGSDLALPHPLFYTDSAPQGGSMPPWLNFVAAGPASVTWTPGTELQLRGPLGRGFSLPLSARRVGLIAFDHSPARLRGLIQQSLKQEAAVVLVGDSVPDNLHDEVEIQPLSALDDILEWADYVAFDIAREHLNQLRERLGKGNSLAAGLGAQVLIRTPVPCGGIAECGVCAVTFRSDWKLACKEGPVFDWNEL